jgi:hypothetical protein
MARFQINKQTLEPKATAINYRLARWIVDALYVRLFGDTPEYWFVMTNCAT